MSVVAQELPGSPAPPDPEVLVSRLWLQEETLGMPGMGATMPGMGSGSFLGIGVADVNAEMAERLKMGEPRGVVVTSVSGGSPAEKAGIRLNDVLVSYNGSTLEGGQQLRRMVGETPAGRTIRLQVLRDGAQIAISVVTAARRPTRDYALGFDVESARDAAESARGAMDRMWVVAADIPRMLTVYRLASLGIDSEPLSSQLATYFGVKEGALVREVEENSAAAKAGVKAGDVIVGLADQPVSKPADLTRILKEQKAAASPLKLSLVRNQKELTVPVVPEDPAGRGRQRGATVARPSQPVRVVAPRQAPSPRAISIGTNPSN
ncbi:MAG: PDZ domain-containing protein [Bryobacterales bacterium]|jgi:serine protease Do|nr:PDZ domain-containing protein [Bryobacterales bacterium]